MSGAHAISLPAPTRSTVQPHEALRDALAQVVADARREARRDLELIRAEAATTIAGLRAEVVETRAAVERLTAERLALLKDGAPGPAGERGPEGPPGKLSEIKGWAEGVHYEGDVRAHKGSTYQALKDTGREPPHADWALLAAAGRDGADGRSWTIRGTFSATEKYLELDVVALNGASFAARKDDPGPCPGEGWQLIAGQGKTGKPGERGEKGDRGPKGEAGPPVVAMDVDDQGLVTLTNADGSVITCDLYPVLAKLDR